MFSFSNTDFFDRIDQSLNKRTASFPEAPSEHQSRSQHSGSTSINDSRAEEGSSISRRGTQTSNSDAKGAKSRGVKSAYNSKIKITKEEKIISYPC